MAASDIVDAAATVTPKRRGYMNAYPRVEALVDELLDAFIEGKATINTPKGPLPFTVATLHTMVERLVSSRGLAPKAPTLQAIEKHLVRHRRAQLERLREIQLT